MKLDVFILPAAREEISTARDWYEGEVLGLGARFFDELTHQIEGISTSPFHFPMVQADVRRARLRHYPYGLFFRQVGDSIYIIACFHSSRDPMIWRDRI